jgi:peptide/nickel transport system substrate-binding protein
MFASYVLGLSDTFGHPELVGANWTLVGFRAVERWCFN